MLLNSVGALLQVVLAYGAESDRPLRIPGEVRSSSSGLSIGSTQQCPDTAGD